MTLKKWTLPKNYFAIEAFIQADGSIRLLASARQYLDDNDGAEVDDPVN